MSFFSENTSKSSNFAATVCELDRYQMLSSTILMISVVFFYMSLKVLSAQVFCWFNKDKSSYLNLENLGERALIAIISTDKFLVLFCKEDELIVFAFYGKLT